MYVHRSPQITSGVRPTSACSPQLLAPGSRPDTLASLRRGLVVVSDAASPTVDVLVAALSACGFSVKGLTDSTEALAKLRAAPPSVVLLDMVMPELDGAQLLRSIKTERRLADTRVIMLSGLPESMVRRRCSGYAAFVRKPFTLDELLAAIQSVPQ